MEIEEVIPILNIAWTLTEDHGRCLLNIYPFVKYIVPVNMHKRVYILCPEACLFYYVCKCPCVWVYSQLVFTYFNGVILSVLCWISSVSACVVVFALAQKTTTQTTEGRWILYPFIKYIVPVHIHECVYILCGQACLFYYVWICPDVWVYFQCFLNGLI